jgi:hypothetical protein
MGAISQGNSTNNLDQGEVVISNGLATSDANAYKAEVDQNNRLHVNPSSPYKLKALINTSTVALSQSYVDVLNVSGPGELMGFKLVVSNGSASVRLEIDGEESFAVNFDDLRDCNFAAWNNSGVNRYFGTSQYGEMEFFLPVPTQFSSSLKVQIKKDVSWSINRTKAVVIYAI